MKKYINRFLCALLALSSTTYSMKNEKNICEKIENMVEFDSSPRSISKPKPDYKLNEKVFNEIIQDIEDTDEEVIIKLRSHEKNDIKLRGHEKNDAERNIIRILIFRIGCWERSLPESNNSSSQKIFNSYVAVAEKLKERLLPENWNTLLHEQHKDGDSAISVLNRCEQYQAMFPQPYLRRLSKLLKPHEQEKGAIAPAPHNSPPIDKTVRREATIKRKKIKETKEEEEKTKVQAQEKPKISNETTAEFRTPPSPIISKLLLFSGITATACIAGFCLWKLTSSNKKEEAK